MSEQGAWQAAVALIAGGFRQGKGYARLSANRSGRFNADVLRNGVGRLEADASDVLGQAIRIFLDGLDSVLPILLVDANRLRRAHTMAVQKYHDFPNDLLIRPAGRDLRNSLWADASKEALQNPHL